MILRGLYERHPNNALPHFLGRRHMVDPLNSHPLSNMVYPIKKYDKEVRYRAIKEMWDKGSFLYQCSKCWDVWRSKKYWVEDICRKCSSERFDFFVKK